MYRRRWMKLVKDYDCEINYHIEKANFVANVLSRKHLGHCTMLLMTQKEILQDLRNPDVKVVIG